LRQRLELKIHAVIRVTEKKMDSSGQRRREWGWVGGVVGGGDKVPRTGSKAKRGVGTLYSGNAIHFHADPSPSCFDPGVTRNVADLVFRPSKHVFADLSVRRARIGRRAADEASTDCPAPVAVDELFTRDPMAVCPAPPVWRERAREKRSAFRRSLLTHSHARTHADQQGRARYWSDSVQNLRRTK